MFGLSEALVREVLATAPRPKREKNSGKGPNGFKQASQKAWQRVVARFDRLTARPYHFVGFTSLLWLLLLLFRSARADADRINRTISFGFSLSGGAGLAVIAALTVLVLQVVCIYRRRQPKLALFAGACLWVVLFVSFVFSLSRDPSPPQDLHPAALVAIVTIGLGFLSLLYAGFGTLVAVLGGWVHLRLRKEASERRSRHELLSAYFEIQSRLESAQPAMESRPELPLVRSVRNHPLLWALGLALVGAFSVMALTISTGVNPQNPQEPGAVALIYALASLVLTIFSISTFIAIVYLANSFKKAMAAVFLSTIVGSLPMLIPIGHFGPAYLFSFNNLVGLAVGTVGYTVIAAVASVAAHIQAENKKERGLAQNEPSALLSELIRLQWKLAEGITEVCVLVVDAAGSSKMKSEADPLVVEFSFRAYQGWISRICAHHGGRIHATAGDGAVLAFPTCDGAMAAAQAMRSDLERFNRDENRLPSPFRLRIGLHVGEVVADLDKVEFAEVIDVAAHVEGMAPIGGIAVTRRVAERLPGLPFEPSGEVDGQQVVVLPPGVPA